MFREVLRALGCLICCVFLVLLVPSSAWSQDTGGSSGGSESSSPSPSPSESPAPELSGDSSSSSPSPEPSTSDAPPVDQSDPAVAEPSAEPTDPTATETVTVTAEPEPEPQLDEMTGTEDQPTIVRLDNESTALMLLGIALSVLCLGVMAVTSFGGK